MQHETFDVTPTLTEELVHVCAQPLVTRFITPAPTSVLFFVKQKFYLKINTSNEIIFNPAHTEQLMLFGDWHMTSLDVSPIPHAVHS